MFRKPKKIQRRIFSSTLEDDDEERAVENIEDDEIHAPPPPIISKKEKSSSRETKKATSSKSEAPPPVAGSGQTKALLSFADDEDDAEVFQVRKSSHSKKMMRMLDKERRKKKREERDGVGFGGNSSSSQTATIHQSEALERNGNGHHRSSGGSRYHSSGNSSSSNNNNGSLNLGSTTTASASSSKYKKASSTGVVHHTASAAEQCKSKKSDSIQTEIRTDDFVLVVKKSEPELILNGRAAFCAGRDDLSDDDDETAAARAEEADGSHRFTKPEMLKQMLESGSIPDAAMIHAARKRRQKAREQGDFVPIEEPKEAPKKGGRLTREDMEDDNSDEEERVDMSDISGKKERDERREQFYAAVENDYSEDSEHELNDWENQQIRKGVTGAQLVSVQQESVLARFLIKPSTSSSSSSAAAAAAASTLLDYPHKQPQSTATLLEQAYAKSALERPLTAAATAATKAKTVKAKATALRTPPEIRDAIRQRLTKVKELNQRHTSDIERIAGELQLLRLSELDCGQRAPTSAAKYRFYQEVKCYTADLVDCLNEKVPAVNELEKRSLQLFAKHQSFLTERRRQDVRDQAKEMAEAAKPATARRAGAEQEEQVRRAAEREGRRTRRRCEREKNGQLAAHLDGMSSDEETSDHYQEQFQNSIEQIAKEAEEIFGDVNDEFFKVDLILLKLFAWRKTDMEAYKDAFVSLCIPKLLGPLIRLEMLTWSPLLDEYKDIEKMCWYSAAMLYAWAEHETEASLKMDPDVQLVPQIIEKIVVPKLTEIVNQCWDPLSTTQTLRLIGFINRLGRDYPLKENTRTLQRLFAAILEKMKLALDNDVFIPIFPKQVQEAKTSFFQRQFCSGLKLFRNFLSWQGIIADRPLRELAIAALLNRYLLLAMRVCSANDAIAKAYIVVNTLPTVWLQPNSETLKNMQLFITYIKQTLESCDAKNPLFIQTCDKAKQILQRLHSL